MTTLKERRIWCEVCNTTKHSSNTCGKVLGYKMILFQFLKSIKCDPSSNTVVSPGTKYEKQFLKYAISYLRINGYLDIESNSRVFADFEMKKPLNKSPYDTLITYFNVSLFQIRIKIRELRYDSNQCPICMERMRTKTTVTECGHKFCTKCINTYTGKELSTKSSVNCPCCRSVILSIS